MKEARQKKKKNKKKNTQIRTKKLNEVTVKTTNLYINSL